MKKLLSLLLVLVLCTGVLAGCSGSNNNGGDNSNRTVILLGVSSDITSLDPQNHNDATSAYMTRHIYSNLVRLDENNEFVGDLAESWEYVDDVTVNFTLKEGVKFHNGEPLTSEDVKFTMERLAESTKVAHLIKMIESVEVIDDTHFTIHLNTPSNALISSLYHSGGAILCKSWIEAGNDIAEKPNGTGPYKYKEYITGTSCELEKNAEYFDETRMAQNDGIKIVVYTDDSARTIALETGEIDMCMKVPTIDAKKIRENEALVLNEGPYTLIEYMGFTTNKAPFDNVKVRQAINYAIKKDKVITAATENEGIQSDTYLIEGTKGYYDSGVKYEYNPETAKQLLTEAGYTESNPLSFKCYVSGEVRAKSATAIQADLKEIGVDMKIEQMESATFYEKCANGEPDAFMAGWLPNAEPDNTYRALWTTEGGNNYTHYANDKVLELTNIGVTSRDPEEIEAAYSEVLKIISEDAIWVPLYTQNSQIGHRAGLQGVHNSMIGMHDFYAVHY